MGRHYDDSNYSKKDIIKCKAKAKKAFKESKGEISIKRLERVSKLSQKTLKKFIQEENWKDWVVEDKGDRVTLSKETKDFIANRADELGLDERERLFCYHYLKTFNQTTAAARAGFSPVSTHSAGSMTMKKPHIKQFLKECKAHRDTELFIDIMDVVDLRARIAFSDITDVMQFKGTDARLKSSSVVDGQVIQEVHVKEDGFKVKMYDKEKALKELEKYLCGNTEETKLQLEQKKFDLQKAKVLFEMENTIQGNVSNLEEVDSLRKKMKKRKKAIEGDE